MAPISKKWKLRNGGKLAANGRFLREFYYESYNILGSKKFPMISMNFLFINVTTFLLKIGVENAKIKGQRPKDLIK